ncbi:MAG: hypothetical protein IBX61_01480 [Thermoleophilia bacterium]|nr:hypothetical protein [Thermoleophilia bacterium]
MEKNKLHDEVNIAVPAREAMSKVVRMATTAVASRASLSIDDADDLNTAVEELFRSFLSQHTAGEVDFCVDYIFHDDRLEIAAHGCILHNGHGKVGRYSRFLLESLADSVREVTNPDGGLDVVLVKNLPGS